MEKIHLWVDNGVQSVKTQELLHKLGYNPIYCDRVQPCHNTRHYIRCDIHGDIHSGTDADILNMYITGSREVTLSELESMVKEKEMSKLRTKEDYRKMKPTDMIDVVIDSHKFNVTLNELILLTNYLGNSVGLSGLYTFWDTLDEIFGTKASGKVVAIGFNEDTSSYFIPEETVKKLNEIESINETIKELQIKVNSLKESL